MSNFMLDLLAQSEYPTGADLNHWEGSWTMANDPRIKQAADFIILRAGYGAQSGQTFTDKEFGQHYAELEKHPEILRGVYWYLSSVADKHAQLNHFIGLLSGKDFDFIVVDFETAFNTKSRKFAETLIWMLEALQKLFPDKRIFLYANAPTYNAWLRPYLSDQELNKWPYWHAQYPWVSWKNTTEYFKQWMTDLIVKATKKPRLPKGKTQGDVEIWQLVDQSGLGHEFGLEADQLDINIGRRKYPDFVEYIGRPERWKDIPEEVDTEIPTDTKSWEAGFEVGVKYERERIRKLLDE